ncbi:hypothetical protein KM867_09125 [Micrococcus luteus]|uniref:hypothetical protein n=1 Tax=Micrococcus luteus TaxID=1270 RepID=UPI001C22A832|nr:hypothetical protein [Micrococcus luteus]MBU8650792.1 hypothetical protein [Micrococcus luteus]
MQHTPPDGRQALGEYLALILDPAVLDDPAALDAQFRAAAADAVLGCYEPDGPAPEYRHHREVNEAADIYTAALNCAHPHTFPAALAAEEARLKRNAYIRDHYREHTTAVGLLAATAAHLRDLASRTD